MCSVEISGNHPAQMAKEKQIGLEKGQNGEVKCSASHWICLWDSV